MSRTFFNYYAGNKEKQQLEREKICGIKLANVLYLTGYSEISHFLCEEFKILLKVVTLVFASTTGKRFLPIKINKNYLDSVPDLSGVSAFGKI